MDLSYIGDSLVLTRTKRFLAHNAQLHIGQRDMSEGPEKPEKTVKPEAGAPEAPKKKSWSNPALRAMGIPRILLPSRNWMIFWTVLAGVTGGIAYDKYQQKQVRKKYTAEVEKLGEELYDTTRVPRRLTIFIAPPPNDFLQESLKHFRKYIKPILNAAAIDFTIFTEERQGDIRHEVADKIRQLRRERLAEKLKEEEKIKQEAYDKSWTKFFKEGVPNAFKSLRKKPEEPEVFVSRHELYSPADLLGLYKVVKPMEPERDDSKDFLLSGGVLCIGRGTYKEYMTGVHEGLLGPLEAPAPPPEVKKIEETLNTEAPSSEASGTETSAETEKKEETPDEIEDFGLHTRRNELPPVPKPFILPADYANAPLAPELNMNEVVLNDKNVPVLFEQPVGVFTVPKLSGIMNTPTKIYRYYTKRYLAAEVAEHAQKVVYSESRPFQNLDSFLGAEEEMDWPRKWIERGKKKNSEWVQPLEVDPRVILRMRVFNFGETSNKGINVATDVESVEEKKIEEVKIEQPKAEEK